MQNSLRRAQGRIGPIRSGIIEQPEEQTVSLDDLEEVDEGSSNCE